LVRRKSGDPPRVIVRPHGVPVARPPVASVLRAIRLARACPWRSKVGCGCSQVMCHRDDKRKSIADCLECAVRMADRALTAPIGRASRRSGDPH
jgi:hypothetical protein